MRLASVGFQAYTSLLACLLASRVSYLKRIAEIRVCERVAVEIGHCVAFLTRVSCVRELPDSPGKAQVL